MKKLRFPSLGGKFNVGDLDKLSGLCIKHQIEDFFLTSRQEIILKISEEKESELIPDLQKSRIVFHRQEDSFVNVISSYPSLGIWSSKKWINASTYNNVLKSFGEQNLLSISIVDDNQDLTGLCDSELNFVASDQMNFWYLYISLAKEKEPFLWPVLIDSDSLPWISKTIEKLYLENPRITGEKLVDIINERIQYSYRGFKKTSALRIQKVPYYDGFHKQENGSFWLGITTRGNKFKTTFLDYLVKLCKDDEIFQVQATTWSSFIINGISEKSIDRWDEFLVLYDIITGHAYYEINWKFNNDFSYHQEIKDKLISVFYQKKVRTWGLSFGIFSKKREFATTTFSIKVKPIVSRLGLFVYDIYVAKDYNPNNQISILKASNLSFKELSNNLIDYIKTSHKEIYLESKLGNSTVYENNRSNNTEEIHQCGVCYTIYEVLDGSGEFQPPFNQLSKAYTCPTCGSPKQGYKKVQGLEV